MKNYILVLFALASFLHFSCRSGRLEIVPVEGGLVAGVARPAMNILNTSGNFAKEPH